MAVVLKTSENLDTPVWVSVDFAARWAGVNPKTVRKLISTGKLQATYFTARTLRVRFESLVALAEKNATGKWAA